MRFRFYSVFFVSSVAPALQRGTSFMKGSRSMRLLVTSMLFFVAACAPDDKPSRLVDMLQNHDGGGGTGDLLPDFDGGKGDAGSPCGSVQTGSNGIVVYQVPPACTESGITRWTEDHFAFRDPKASSNGKLVVFFPGTGLLPADYQLVLSTAAQQGYLVVGLRYANDKDVGAISDSSDPNCTEQSRLEILTGKDLSSKVTVGPGDSILNRLVALLLFLDAQHPGEGWGSFVSGGQPLWSSIVAAGHSLGGGEAALIGLKYAVARVVMFSSPNDHSCGDSSVQPAPWEVAGTLTPPMLWFGFGHLWDVNDEPLELSAWNALGMAQFGNPFSVNVEKIMPPYDNSHELKTDALPATCSSQATCATNDAHRSTAVDLDTPLDAGVPHFLSTWRYLLGP